MTEKYRIELSVKAKDDIKNIVLYIKNVLNEPSIASRYAKTIKKEIQTLEYFPQKFAIIDDDTIKDLKIRKINIKNYIAFYRVNEDKKIVSVKECYMAHLIGQTSYISNFAI